jgi:hypothetical protein
MLSDKPLQLCTALDRPPTTACSLVSGVIIDAKGNLFGTTGVGGRHGAFGTVFELSHPQEPGGQWVETVLYRFSGMPDGKNPLGRPVMTSRRFGRDHFTRRR